MKSLLETCIDPNHGDNIVLSTFHHDYSINDIVRETNRYLSLLGESNELNGQRVLLLIPDVVSFVSVLFAVNKLGGTVAPLGMQYRQDDLTAVLDVVKPHIIFTIREHNGVPFSKIVRSWQRNNGSQCTIFESENGFEWIRQEIPGLPLSIEEMDPGLIFFTSGSTGVPKGIVSDQQTFVHHYEMYAWNMNIKSTDRLFNVPPVMGAYGFTSFLSAIHEGFRLAVPDSFDLPKMAQLMKRIECNKILSTPSIMKALYTMTQHLEPTVFQNLKECYLAGEMVSEGMVNEFQLLSHAKFTGVYGLSEAGGVMTSDLRGKLEWAVHPDVQTKFLDANGAKELAVKSPALFQCYYNQPETTQEVMTNDLWFLTGDLVEINANNKIVLVGRKKDLIKKGGQQVVPGEVENVLVDHPAVQQAAVVGIPHPVFGEQVVAFVMAESAVEAAELYEHCIRRIARYKVPDHIEFVQSLPLISGKTDKLTLRKMYANKET